MRRCLFQRGGDAQHVVGLPVRGGNDAGQFGAALGQRAGLVDDQVHRPRHGLQHRPALHQHAAPRRLAHACDDCHRHRQDQRARRGRNQHRQHADVAPREIPGGPRQPHRDGQKHQRIAVGQPHHWRLGSLCRLHQPHDAGIGALGGGPGRHHVEGIVERARAGLHVLAFPAFHRNRFARQRRHVEQGPSTAHPAIHRHDVALADQQPVTGADRIDRHLLEVIVVVAQRGLWNSRQQRLHVGPRPVGGIILEQLATGIHQRNNARRQRFAEQQCRGDRQPRHNVEPHLACNERGDDIVEQHRQHRAGGQPPDPALNGAKPHERREQAADEAGDRNDEQSDADLVQNNASWLRNLQLHLASAMTEIKNHLVSNDCGCLQTWLFINGAFTLPCHLSRKA